MNVALLGNLTLRMAGREIVSRYRGSLGGLAWVVLAPILLLAIYTFVFAVIFRARWPGLGPEASGAGEFALIVFSGMLLHGFFADCLGRAPMLILGNVNFVKKTVFPLEVLAGSQLLAALALLVPTFCVLIVFQFFVFGFPPATALLFPLILLPVALFALGFMWIIAALTVYFRDLTQLIGLLITALFFLSPVLYPTSSVPEQLQTVFHANPLTFPIEATRNLLFWGELPSIGSYMAYLGVSIAFASLGLRLFRVLRDGFADAL